MATLNDALYEGDSRDWLDQLESVSVRLWPRPISLVIETRKGTRVVRGWRRDDIDEVLDACAKVDGDYSPEAMAFGAVRSLRRWANKLEGQRSAKRDWAKRNRQRAQQNSRLQSQKLYQQMKADHQKALELFEAVAERELVAPGVDPFRRFFWAAWKSGDHDQVVTGMIRWARGRHSMRDQIDLEVRIAIAEKPPGTQ